MKTSRTKTVRRFHKIPRVVFARESRLTSYAGLILFQSLFVRLDLKARLRACFERSGSQAIYHPASVMLLLVIHILIGFRRLRGLEYYRDDPLVARYQADVRWADAYLVVHPGGGSHDRRSHAIS